MATKLNRKDIEEFWRRSNSICDKESSSSPDAVAVQVRRMSLAEFTGLDSGQKLAELEAPTWKSTVSQSSLLNSFSNRRRSVLSNADTIESPSRKLTTQNEVDDEFDVQTAVSRIQAIASKCGKIDKKTESLEIDMKAEKQKAIEAIGRISQITKQMGQGPSHSSLGPLLAEAVASSEALSRSVHTMAAQSTVYHSELLNTEIAQAFDSLISLVSKLDSATLSANMSTPRRKMSLISNSEALLQANLNVLLRAITSI
ncbi:unnamed protein product [Caenorhabditis bovis]|uniref:Uncharacterized protein n=1 Tax=Caenorhabditis bovis TaxID=2654633 RepID=A0A8S1ETN6_9PELO|nr:unnamed protein product [Caenorhabditis bovis]